MSNRTHVTSALPPAVSDESRVAALHALGLLDTLPEADFDDIAGLAAHACGTPIALVSLVDKDRQWFKARVGFEPCGTDLGSSVCVHTLDSDDLLVVPDLSTDPRLQANPLVIGKPGIRFYAGAPLRIPEGKALGALCVMDTVPRPEGLTPAQRRALLTLARQVMLLIDMRRAVSGRDVIIARERSDGRSLGLETDRLRIGEAHWRGLFERLHEAFIVAEAVRDAAGTVHDWRYLAVNPSWSALMGVDPALAIGRTIRAVFPGVENADVIDLARVVDTREAATTMWQLPAAQRWFEGRAFPLDGDRFAVISLEVTGRVLADARRDALLLLNDTVRDLDDPTAIIQAAAGIVGRVLDLDRAGFARVDSDEGHATVQAEWVAATLPNAVGQHRLPEYGRPHDALHPTSPLVVDDVLTDPRTADDPGRFLALGTRALVSMPVVERGRRVAAFYAHSAKPRVWSEDALVFLCNVAERVELALARAAAEADQALQNMELGHRLKNTLAMVQAIARQTMKRAADQDAVAAFTERVQTLGQAHQVLLDRNWTTSSIVTVVNSVLGRLGLNRFDVSGPDMLVGSRTTLSFSLVLHELATNAVKYGALSNEHGRVSVSWSIEGGNVLLFGWTERGGPPAAEPVRTGFGAKLIASGLVGSGGVVTRYLDTGFEAEFRCPLRNAQEY